MRIVGHTDASGPAGYNQKLSVLRAEEVQRFFVNDCRIAPDRLQAIGVGEQFPYDDRDPLRRRQPPRGVPGDQLRRAPLRRSLAGLGDYSRPFSWALSFPPASTAPSLGRLVWQVSRVLFNSLVWQYFGKVYRK